MKIILARWIITTMCAHILGGIVIGVSAMGSTGFPAGFMFALLGCFYLIVEAPIVFIGQAILDRISSRLAGAAVGVALMILGCILGYGLCFTEGGVRPSEYALGYSIAGGLLGLLIYVSTLICPRSSRPGEQVVVANPPLAPCSADDGR